MPVVIAIMAEMASAEKMDFFMKSLKSQNNIWCIERKPSEAFRKIIVAFK